MWKRFILWLMRPVIDEIKTHHCARISATEAHMQKERIAIGGLIAASTREIETRLVIVKEDNVQAARRLECKIEEAEAAWNSWPRLMPETLQAWDAVSYARDKYERDRDSHGMVNRESEIIAWAKIYLGENGLAVPSDQELKQIIKLKDSLTAKTAVSVSQ